MINDQSRNLRECSEGIETDCCISIVKRDFQVNRYEIRFSIIESQAKADQSIGTSIAIIIWQLDIKCECQDESDLCVFDSHC